MRAGNLAMNYTATWEAQLAIAKQNHDMMVQVATIGRHKFEGVDCGSSARMMSMKRLLRNKAQISSENLSIENWRACGPKLFRGWTTPIQFHTCEMLKSLVILALLLPTLAVCVTCQTLVTSHLMGSHHRYTEPPMQLRPGKIKTIHFFTTKTTHTAMMRSQIKMR